MPVHRISQGSGVWMLTDAEITEMVEATDRTRHRALPVHRTARHLGHRRLHAHRLRGGGLRARGHDAVAGCVEDALRATELGVNCLLVADEGVLWTLHRARARGVLPADTTLKVSALIGPVNPASYAVYERLGADSLNVPSDLTLDSPHRDPAGFAAPMDMYIEAPDDLGGYVRMYEVAELIRRGAPIYLKFGLSKAPGIYPYGHHLRDLTLNTARERVRRGRLALDLLARHGADGDMAPLGSRLPGGLSGSTRPHNVPGQPLHKRRRSRTQSHTPLLGPLAPLFEASPHRETESGPTTSRMMIMRNRRAALAAIAGAASLALTLTACGQDSEGGSDAASDSAKGGTIGIAMPTKSSERWIADGNNVVKDLESKGYKTQLVYGEDDPDQQVSQIENLITQGVKALIIAAIDNKSMNNVLQQAADAKIPVISYDRLILGTKNVDYYASFDNEKVGELQGNYILEKLGLADGSKKGPFNIELFAGSNDDNNTKYFFQRRDERPAAVHRQEAARRPVRADQR